MGDTSTATDAAYAQESNLAGILAPSVVIHVVALVFVGMRCYSRFCIKHCFGKDDILMVMGTVFTIGGIITIIGLAFHGLGRHWSVVSVDDRVKFQMWNFAHTMVAQITGLTLVKASIATSLLRMSDRRVFRWILWPAITVLVAICICSYFLFLLRCIPLQGFFDDRVEAYCYPVSTFVKLAVFNTCFNIATDIICATLPIPMIWSLQMKLRTRLYLIAIFSLGWLAVAMGILKGMYQISYAMETDVSFKYGVQFWGFLQINFAIIAACSPSLRSLLGGLLHLSNEAVSSRLQSGADQRAGRPNVLRTFGGGPIGRNGDSASIDGAGSPYGFRKNEADVRLEDMELDRSNSGRGMGYHASIRVGRRSAVDSTEEILERGPKQDRADDDRVSGTGSEEMILNRPKESIVKTTEVEIHDG